MNVSVKRLLFLCGGVVFAMALGLYLLQQGTPDASHSMTGAAEVPVDGDTGTQPADTVTSSSGNDNSTTSDTSTYNSRESRLDPAVRQAIEEMTNTSSEGLTEEKTEHGYEVDLEGRFRSVPVAEIDENGEVSVRDYLSAPGGGGGE